MARFLSLVELLEGRHCDREIIVLCVEWYLRFKLDIRDLVEMMAKRNLSMAQATIMRWSIIMRQSSSVGGTGSLGQLRHRGPSTRPAGRSAPVGEF
jgi:hypothetical protein